MHPIHRRKIISLKLRTKPVLIPQVPLSDMKGWFWPAWTAQRVGEQTAPDA